MRTPDKKIKRPRAIAKSVHQKKILLLKSLCVLLFISLIFLFQTIAKADQAAVVSPKVPKRNRPLLSDECKSLISQMRELRKSMREKRDELRENGQKLELEFDEDGNPIFPAEVQEIRDQKLALKEQLKANNCPKPPKGKRKAKRKAKREAKREAKKKANM